MGQTGVFSLVFIALVAFSEQVLGGGYKGLLCGENPLVTCNDDCTGNHGSLKGGTCGRLSDGDYNCYCHHQRAPVPNPNTLQCMAGVRPGYAQAVCELDCTCNHGAVGGECDFERQACVCHGVGLNKENENCIADTVPRFAELFVTLLGADALGEAGMAFIEKALKFKSYNSATDDSSYEAY